MPASPINSAPGGPEEPPAGPAAGSLWNPVRLFGLTPGPDPLRSQRCFVLERSPNGFVERCPEAPFGVSYPVTVQRTVAALQTRCPSRCLSANRDLAVLASLCICKKHTNHFRVNDLVRYWMVSIATEMMNTTPDLEEAMRQRNLALGVLRDAFASMSRGEIRGLQCLENWSTDRRGYMAEHQRLNSMNYELDQKAAMYEAECYRLREELDLLETDRVAPTQTYGRLQVARREIIRLTEELAQTRDTGHRVTRQVFDWAMEGQASLRGMVLQERAWVRQLQAHKAELDRLLVDSLDALAAVAGEDQHAEQDHESGRNDET